MRSAAEGELRAAAAALDAWNEAAYIAVEEANSGSARSYATTVASDRFMQKIWGSMLLGATALGAIGLWPAGCATSSTTTPTAEASKPKSTPAAHPALSGLGETTIADVAERTLPSVVSVLATKVEQRPQAGQFPFPFPFPFGPTPDGPPREGHGIGSGVVVTADGVVLTNNHVVEGAQNIRVVSNDNREFAATIVGTDPKSDLAVLRITDKAAGLKPITVGDSSKVRLGEVVLAIGNPFGVGQTVTMGIVSAKGRSDVGITAYEDFIQTDAAINPGNSGGALVNLRGELVGINTAILSRSGGNMGIGFAIPTDMAKPIMQSLLKFGRVDRGWLGVSIQDVTQDLAKALKLPSSSGVLIADVLPDGPASKGGLRRGDVVTKVNGQSVDTTGRLRNLVAAAGARTKCKLEVLRSGKVEVLELVLGEMPEDRADGSGVRPSAPNAPPAGSTLDGLTLENLSESSRQTFRLPRELNRGVVVTKLDPGSPAARAGLRPGDVLLEVNQKPVDNVEAFKTAWSAAKGKTLLLVSRQGTTTFIVVDR